MRSAKWSMVSLFTIIRNLLSRIASFFFFFKEIGALGRCCRQPTLKYGAALSPVTKVRCTNRSLCRGEVALGGGCVVYAVNSLCIPSPWCRAETVSVNRTLIAL